MHPRIGDFPWAITTCSYVGTLLNTERESQLRSLEVGMLRDERMQGTHQHANSLPRIAAGSAKQVIKN